MCSSHTHNLKLTVPTQVITIWVRSCLGQGIVLHLPPLDAVHNGMVEHGLLTFWWCVPSRQVTFQRLKDTLGFMSRGAHKAAGHPLMGVMFGGRGPRWGSEVGAFGPSDKRRQVW